MPADLSSQALASRLPASSLFGIDDAKRFDPSQADGLNAVRARGELSHEKLEVVGRHAVMPLHRLDLGPRPHGFRLPASLGRGIHRAKGSDLGLGRAPGRESQEKEGEDQEEVVEVLSSEGASPIAARAKSLMISSFRQAPIVGSARIASIS